MRRKKSPSFIHYSFLKIFTQERFYYDSRWLDLYVDGGHDRDGTFCLVLLESRDDFVPGGMIRTFGLDKRNRKSRGVETAWLKLKILSRFRKHVSHIIQRTE